ncbi:MAG: hypothetical protein KF769_10665 [Parvibaculum sp.]|nr:hypothetical protein [Parvibaculum sp.]
MRQKLFIHIGPHKTGTSSLQRFLFDNRRELLKLGVCYPTAHLDGYRAQHRFAFAVRQKSDPGDRQVPSRETEIGPIISEIKSSGADAAIISSEAFFVTAEPDIRFLQEQLRDFETVIVFYARRQDEGYVSTYTQRAKSPRNAFAQPIHAHLKHPIDMSRDLDIHECVSNWARVFGRENVAARLYDRKISVPEDFLRCIDERRAGRPALAPMMGQFKVSKDVNKSPSLEATELIRLSKTQHGNPQGRQATLELVRTHFENGRSAAKLLSTADRRTILEFFRPSNEKLFRKYFFCENKFAPELLLTGEETDRERLTIEDTAKMVVELVVQQKAVMNRRPHVRAQRAVAAALRRLRSILGN